MRADGRAAAAEPARAAHSVLAIAALDFEAEPLRRHGRRAAAARPAPQRSCDLPALVQQSGPGAERAAAAASAALAAGATALVSWGVAGALVPNLAPGTVLLPRTVASAGGARYACAAPWQAALAAALSTDFPFSDAPLLSSEAVLETPATKAHAAEQTGAAAVDMESAAIAAVAARAGAPFVAVRVVVDGARDTLPAGADRWVDSAGNRRIAAALEAAVRPREWGALWLLAHRYRAATRTLERLAARLAPAGFLLDAPR